MRQLVAGEIEIHEPTQWTRVSPLVLGDDGRHDVAADVFDVAQLDLLHPAEITTRRVEQYPRLERPQRGRQPVPHDASGIQTRAHPRARLRISPQVGLVDALEPFFETEPRELLRVLGELALGDGPRSLPGHAIKVLSAPAADQARSTTGCARRHHSHNWATVAFSHDSGTGTRRHFFPSSRSKQSQPFS